jgi:hypothetical protein
MSYLNSPKDPIRDVLKAMTGKAPPAFVRGYTCHNLPDTKWDALQSWAVNNCKPSYLTGIGLIEAAHQQVDEAVSNGNIPPPGYPCGNRVDFVLKLFRALSKRHGDLLVELRQATIELAYKQKEAAACPVETHTRTRGSKKKWRMRVSSTRS